MRYAITLKPQGAIPADLGMVIPLADAGGAAAGATAINTTTNIECLVSRIDSWIVESSANQTREVNTAVQLLPDSSYSTVPFANSCVYASITIASGCMADGDCLEWAASSVEVDMRFTFIPGARFANAASCVATSCIIDRTSGNRDYTGLSFTIQASLNGSPIGPPIVFECQPTLRNSTWESWSIDYIDNFAVSCDPSQTAGDRRTYFADASGGCQIAVAPVGIVWHSSDDLTWTITQLTGPTLPVTAVNNICSSTDFRFDSASNYTGTSYLLSATLNGVAYGSSITIQSGV